MPNERHVSDEEIRRWTREFLASDFWKFVVKPKLDLERVNISNLKRMSAVKGELNLPFGWEFYLMALDDFELSWLPMWKGPDNLEDEPDLSPADYVTPRYPKSDSEVN